MDRQRRQRGERNLPRQGKGRPVLGGDHREVLHYPPQRFLGDDVLVVLARISVNGESAEQAGVLTYRAGKVVQFRSMSDTALQERVYGHK